MQVLPQIRITIRYTVREKHDIVIILVSVLECQAIILFAKRVLWLLFYAVLVVFDIITGLEPTNLLFLSTLLRVDRNLHPKVEQTIRLGEVEDVEADCLTSTCIHRAEVEPLRMALCVDVVLHEEVILVI